jgi:hypothetical protein
VVIPLLLAVGAGGAFFWNQRRQRAPKALEVEVEPNNETASANPIASGRPIRGKIGQRLGRDEGDRDVFRVPAEGSGARLLRVEVTGVPNIDLVLEVFDARGEFLAQADERGEGEGEIIPNLRIGEGDAYVVVREARSPGKVAGENVTDEYSLTASWHALAQDEEAEPNDAPGQVTKLQPGVELRGYLGRRGDVDTFAIEAPAGTKLHGTLILPSGVAARCRVGDRPDKDVQAGGEPWAFEVTAGETIRLERVDPPAEKADKPLLPGLGEPYRIVVK